jgi:hypothetical protein
MSSYYLSLAKWVCVACAVDDLWKADTLTLFTSRMSAMQHRAKEYTKKDGDSYYFIDCAPDVCQ